MVESEVEEQLQKKVRNGDHLCLFYEKEAPEQMVALVPSIEHRDNMATWTEDMRHTH